MIKVEELINFIGSYIFSNSCFMLSINASTPFPVLHDIQQSGTLSISVGLSLNSGSKRSVLFITIMVLFLSNTSVTNSVNPRALEPSSWLSSCIENDCRSLLVSRQSTWRLESAMRIFKSADSALKGQ